MLFFHVVLTKSKKIFNNFKVNLSFLYDFARTVYACCISHTFVELKMGGGNGFVCG